MGEETASETVGGLIDLSSLSLNDLVDHVDQSSLARTLNRLLTSAEAEAREIAGWSACL